MGETLEKNKIARLTLFPSPHSTPTLGPPPPFPSLKALK